MVPRRGRHPRARHHAPGAARRLRNDRAVDARAAGTGALRSLHLGLGDRPSRSTTSSSGGPCTPCPPASSVSASEVRADSRLVRIYHRGEVIKVHPPPAARGSRHRLRGLPEDRAPYAMRAPDTQAEQGGPAVGQFVRVLLSGVSSRGPGCARPRSCSAWRIASAPPSCCWCSATPAPTILDDFGLAQAHRESSDFFDVLVERDRRAATVITSNRAVDEWVALFDEPILANSALDRFAHRAHQVVMEGPSLRAARAPSPTRGSCRSAHDGAPG
jgi:hypothetical protein